MDQLEFSVTFATVTPESAEYGDFEETGFEHESIVFDSVSDLADYIERNGFRNWSSSDGTGWLSTDFEIEDYGTCEEKQLSLHPKNDRAARYMKKAFNLSRK